MSPLKQQIFFFFAFLFIFLVHFPCLAMNVNIRIYTADSLKSIIIAPQTNGYVLEADGKVIDSCKNSSVYEITAIDTLMEIKTLNHEGHYAFAGKYSEIKLTGFDDNDEFKIEPVPQPPKWCEEDAAARLYYDNLDITVANINSLKIINNVELEHYVAGVVQCEAGGCGKGYMEFYKVQAIICRTYVLNNIRRHEKENFELCDLDHCQVYRGVSTIPTILQAVESTKGMVLIDAQGNLINAAFHSNCGGYTENSEDVWTKPLPYLRAVKDTFCLNQPHATWERSFTENEWNSYLAKAETGLKKDTLHPESWYDSIPEQVRTYYYDNGYLIPLKTLRNELLLRSTYFHVEKNGNEIILTGRGNGHRVGLCQEGAMRMAKLGYHYRQILYFYYKGVRITDDSLVSPTGTY